MESALDYTKKFGASDKWNGTFAIKWTFIKDIANHHFRHIVLPNNENKPVTNSRDTQELMVDNGREMLRIFSSFKSKASILNDFPFYDKRQELLEARTQVGGDLHLGGLGGGAVGGGVPQPVAMGGAVGGGLPLPGEMGLGMGSAEPAGGVAGLPLPGMGAPPAVGPAMLLGAGFGGSPNVAPSMGGPAAAGMGGMPGFDHAPLPGMGGGMPSFAPPQQSASQTEYYEAALPAGIAGEAR